ncbi:V-type ATP synthase subunit A [Staphylothermus hellenicus]|uniref:A-type ATP synthase subunit A n=1 Tax=Staphylothermus hellenicus (strain DSM 12710 / JCM 10830 / BK20S6-10-b1 / P8) TaxID=591019 RepID=D7D9E7_STAHD|nr:V-type ATP synthase subunit A [Staphylothermus hellenicus]ADI32393.1 H(+)-transporting two-sector ATPase [Staphylothermus hellenicus DSM 12710]
MSLGITGKIYRVSGPLVIAENMRGSKVYEVVEVGSDRLIGEIIGVEGDKAIIQVYEDTGGLRVGDPVYGTGYPLAAELGPGLVGSIYDGIQRPLPILQELVGFFVKRGVKAEPLPRNKKWHFKPLVKQGEKVGPGDVIGYVDETPVVKHYIMIPPDTHGVVEEIVGEGEYTIVDPIARINGKEIVMLQKWPVRKPRPYREKLEPREPVLTGQRVIDFFFPLAKGGKAAIPGGFGTGKTVTLQQLTKWSAVDIAIYVGCGERGNEMADALHSFRKLVDPRTGKPLVERSVFIANTSNMPVAARETSIFLGATIGEYFRDMGYHVLMVADSTSRWAEAMREISGRLEELPGEEGYPAYLGSRLASFYERSGYVKTLGKPEKTGSLTIMGAVSPPGADFSEPVTQATLRIVRALYALDVNLAYRRHYPAINWLISYSLYVDNVTNWWHENIDPSWRDLREKALAILQKEAELEELVRLVGAEALPEEDKLLLEVARMIREDFLQQNAFHEIDTYCPPRKAVLMMKAIMLFYELGLEAVRRGISVSKIKKLKSRVKIARMKEIPNIDFEDAFKSLFEEIKRDFESLMKEAETIAEL